MGIRKFDDNPHRRESNDGAYPPRQAHLYFNKMMNQLRTNIPGYGTKTKQEVKFRLAEAWKQSGMGLQQYAERHGVPYGTLQYCQKRYRREEQKRTESALFVAFDAAAKARSPAALSGIVIVLPSGVCIEVH